MPNRPTNAGHNGHQRAYRTGEVDVYLMFDALAMNVYDFGVLPQKKCYFFHFTIFLVIHNYVSSLIKQLSCTSDLKTLNIRFGKNFVISFTNI